MELKINKEYKLRLGEADPIRSIYMGRKRYRNGYKHVFLVNEVIYETYTDFRFYLGNLDKTTFEEGIAKIKSPIYKGVRPLEKELIKPLLSKLENQ